MPFGRVKSRYSGKISTMMRVVCLSAMMRTGYVSYLKAPAFFRGDSKEKAVRGAPGGWCDSFLKGFAFLLAVSAADPSTSESNFALRLLLEFY